MYDGMVVEEIHVNNGDIKYVQKMVYLFDVFTHHTNYYPLTTHHGIHLLLENRGTYHTGRRHKKMEE